MLMIMRMVKWLSRQFQALIPPLKHWKTDRNCPASTLAGLWKTKVCSSLNEYSTKKKTTCKLRRLCDLFACVPPSSQHQGGSVETTVPMFLVWTLVLGWKALICELLFMSIQLVWGYRGPNQVLVCLDWELRPENLNILFKKAVKHTNNPQISGVKD